MELLNIDKYSFYSMKMLTLLNLYNVFIKGIIPIIILFSLQCIFYLPINSLDAERSPDKKIGHLKNDYLFV